MKKRPDRNLLTPRQRELLELIEENVLAEQRIPSYREMATSLGVSAVGTVQDHVQALIEHGFLEKRDRYLKLISSPAAGAAPTLHIPILGEVAAGSLHEAIQDPQGLLPLSPEMLKGKAKPEDLFALKVRGESMIDAGIFAGDWIVVQRDERVRSGDIVVVDFEGEATVKEIELPKTRGGAIKLIPRNPNMEPFEIPADERARILGKVVALQRAFS